MSDLNEVLERFNIQIDEIVGIHIDFEISEGKYSVTLNLKPPKKPVTVPLTLAQVLDLLDRCGISKRMLPKAKSNHP